MSDKTRGRRRAHMQAHEAGKRRAQRSSDALQEYLKGLDSEHGSLVAQREYLQARLDLIERQRANLQEVMKIEEKLAELGTRSLDTPEAQPEAVTPEGKAVPA
jgi:chromosome segregation ATPase